MFLQNGKVWTNLPIVLPLGDRRLGHCGRAESINAGGEDMKLGLGRM